MRSDKRGAAQTAYRLTVKNEATGETVWDTGKVMSAASVGIRYAGKALLPATRYAWSVTVWDEDGNAAKPASTWFETGLFDKADWAGADFIAPLTAVKPKNYSIEVDFRIQNMVAGFIFGAVDKSHLLMWQVSSYNHDTGTKDWKLTLRPHVWEGYPTCLESVDQPYHSA